MHSATDGQTDDGIMQKPIVPCAAV